MHSKAFENSQNSRLFLYIGVGLILLALVSSLLTTQVNVQNPEYPHYEDFPTGFLFFAPVIGSYGLTSLALGITEVSASKKEHLLFFLPILGLIYIWTLLVVGNVIWNIIRLGFDYYPLWWLYLIIHLIPSITISLIAFLNFAKRDYLSTILKKKATRTASLGLIVTVPLVSAAVLWILLTST